MAFFGLTGLGSQSPFELAKETPLYVFERVDFQHAFMQTYQSGFTIYSECEQEAEDALRTLQTASISYNQLPQMLQHLYKCPKGVNNVPESAQVLTSEGFQDFEGSGQPIYLDEFLELMETIKDRAQTYEKQAVNQYAYLKEGIKSREFVSNNDFRANLVKHHRMMRDPKDKNLVAMTDAQTLGWSPPAIATMRKPTKSCEETKYASAMVKAGVYYY